MVTLSSTVKKQSIIDIPMILSKCSRFELVIANPRSSVPSQLIDGFYLVRTPVNEPSQKSTLQQEFKLTTEQLKQFIRPNSLIRISFLLIKRETDS